MMGLISLSTVVLNSIINAMLPGIDLENLTTYRDKFIRKAELEKVLGRDVVSVIDVDKMMDRIIPK